MKICVDAGHGGNDTGAPGPTGLDESQVALDISLKVQARLNNNGYEVRLTRSTDIFVELGERCAIANDWGADVFVSIHCNSDGPSAHGIETLYCSSRGLEVAEFVQKALIDATGETDRECKYRSDLFVLNGTEMPAILAEVGFISNPMTETEFRDQAYRQIIAEAIVWGLNEYFPYAADQKRPKD